MELDDLVRQAQEFWAGLDDEQKKKVSIGGVVFLILLSQGGVRLIFAAGAAYMMSLNKPNINTFEPFLKKWYTESYFPKFSEYASKELNDRARQRARSSDMLGSILDKMRSTWVDMTSGIQSQMVYELIVKNNFPPKAYDAGIATLVSVNLGSAVQPMDVWFVGVCHHWFKSPFDGIDFTNLAILQEGQGTPRAGNKKEQ